MIDDVYEPLALYQERFKADHSANTATFFEELVKRSGVDEEQNRIINDQIRSLDTQIGHLGTRHSRWKTLRTFLIAIIVAACVTLAVFLYRIFFDAAGFFTQTDMVVVGVCIVVTGGTIAGLVKLNKTIRSLDQQLQTLSSLRADKLAEAEAQMAPLNRLYDWGMIPKLCQQTVPRLALDPYFSQARLNELVNSFGWDHNFNNDKSVLFAQSGEINGNPFIMAETLDFRMGYETYHGQLLISWRETVPYTDSSGRSRTRQVTRTQTLHASVQKPAPRHSRAKFLIYGNEAAPDLTFSRTPSKLSDQEATRMGKWRLKRTVAKLEAHSRNLKDDSGFTIMANKEFDALFHATDRNNEVQFRLLFTPLAQLQMVKLLRDRVVGYGDNFSFEKNEMINIIHPAHLGGIDISAAPHLFHDHDLEAARTHFNHYSNTYFRALYFALAPLLTIPLYQQHRSHQNIYKDVYGKTASFWEHEAIANFHGQDNFSHPQSITPNILKTRTGGNMGGGTEIAVTAHGFQGLKRVEYVSRLGGDGRMHRVPVHWTEYKPVSRTSRLAVREAEGLTLQDFESQYRTSEEWQAFFRQGGGSSGRPKGLRFRRNIASYLS